MGNVALCEELCDETRFRKFVGGPIVEIRHAVHDSLFTAFDHEASWGIHHRILAPSLTPRAVAGLFTDVRDCASELTAKWRRMSGSNSSTATISPIEELNRLDLESTTLCFYGRKLNGLTGPEPPMIKAMDGATSEAIKRPTRPKFLNWLLYQSKFDRDCKTMRQYASECLEYRKANPTDRKDMLHAMMTAQDPETGKSLTESQIIDEIVTMPIGSSTAPCVIATAMYYLARNPECIRTARDEIATVIGNGAKFTHDHLSHLPYCAAILYETLRLSAAAPGFNIEPIPTNHPQTPNPPIHLSSGKYSLPPTPQKTLIIVLHGVNRDPAVFPHPNEFLPNRMLPESFERLPAGAKKWFGNGKRECIGRHYAWQWCFVVLVVLLRDVEFEGKDGGYVFRQDGWFNLRPVRWEVEVRGREGRGEV